MSLKLEYERINTDELCFMIYGTTLKMYIFWPLHNNTWPLMSNQNRNQNLTGPTGRHVCDITFSFWRCGRTYTVYSFLWRKTGESLVRFIRFVYIREVKSYYACHTFRYLLLLKSIVRSWLSIGSLLRSSVGLSGSLRSRSLNLYQVWYIAPNVLYINAHFVAINLN